MNINSLLTTQNAACNSPQPHLVPLTNTHHPTCCLTLPPRFPRSFSIIKWVSSLNSVQRDWLPPIRHRQITQKWIKKNYSALQSINHVLGKMKFSYIFIIWLACAFAPSPYRTCTHTSRIWHNRPAWNVIMLCSITHLTDSRTMGCWTSAGWIARMAIEGFQRLHTVRCTRWVPYRTERCQPEIS